MIRASHGWVMTEKEAAGYLRSRFSQRTPRGSPCIRDYPMHTLAHARASSALARLHYSSGVLKVDQFYELKARLDDAIHRFTEQQQS